jgi:aerobic-type carbon monoxide dehydrogenase small subunit (CoxS/CutS family)
MSGSGKATHGLAPTTAVPLRLHVNGHDHDVLVEPRATLLETLRHRLELTGTKAGCDHGNCGACTVLLDGTAVYACLRLAVDCEDAAVTTIEGLAGGAPEGATDPDALHPVQQAFIDTDALQCGFCTPGQVMAAVSLLAANPRPSDAEIDQAMSGNLCRCGAYAHIRQAVRLASTRAGGAAEGAAQR